jgi:hypothetical protein
VGAELFLADAKSLLKINHLSPYFFSGSRSEKRVEYLNINEKILVLASAPCPP